jgi:hypothetical protein
MRRAAAVAIVGTGMLIGLFSSVAPASADPNNKNTLAITLDCGASGTVDAVFELSSADSFHAVDVSRNFLWKSLSFTSGGETITITRGIQGQGHSDLVTCTYTGPVSGNDYTAVGFFTP